VLEHVALVVASLLAGTLVWSGSVKVRRPFGAAIALSRFGVVPTVRKSSGRALGLVELAVATLLLAAPLSWVPAGLAGALFAAFALVTLAALQRGERFECACFGRESRIGWHTVLRALGLSLASWTAVASSVAGPGTVDVRDRIVAAVSMGLVLSTVAVAAALASNHPFDPSLREG
jgi:Methylamine utilisation protein MauE